MACSTATATGVMTVEEPILRSAYGTFSREQRQRPTQQRRRHSYHTSHSQPWTVDSENVQVFVDRFLTELGCRLDFLEDYGHLKLDAGIEYAYSTLLAVRDSCSKISDGALEAGRRRAGVLVETLEERYKEALATKDTLEQKVQEGVRIMESYLTEFETRAYAIRDSGIGSVASDFVEGGWQALDGGIERARGVVDGVVDGGRDTARRAKETIEYAVEHALARAKETGLIRYEDLPDPWRINPWIHNGYRFHEGKLDCVLSAFGLHNEMFNIWSHFIGLVIVLAIAFYFFPTHVNFSHFTKADIFIAAVFFFAACKCLACSCIWHTMNSISHQTLMERFACVDYTGISLLIAASILTTEYTAFYCEPVSRGVYMAFTAVLGLGGVVLPWHPTFNRQDMAWARVLFYVSLGATGYLPTVQIIYTRGLQEAYYFYAPIYKSIAVYLLGAVLYASKVPERWFPGRFDYVGASHNLWHVAVLGGILFHYMAMQDMFGHALLRASTQC